MKFIYIDYGKNFINEIKKRKPDEKTIIVFSDYFLKNSYMKNREKNILVLEPEYFTLEEFQKKIFITEKLILTEAKRPLTLFRVLTKDLKEKLKMENYYDIIDFADLFFKYYKELYSAMEEKPEGLEAWQKEYIEKFEILKEVYDKYLLENDFIPSDWIENIENYKEDYTKNYKKIIFADIPYFTPLMREVLKKIETVCEVEIILQIPKEDYNEKLFKIEKVSLVKKKEDINIKIYEHSDEISEIFNMIYLGKSKNHKRKDIFSPVPEKNNYHKIFPRYFVSQKLKTLDDTKLYKFMKIQNELLLSLEPKKRYGISSEELKKALSNEIFRKIYNIDSEAVKKFKKIFDDEYRYIDEKIFENIGYLFKTDEKTEEEILKDVKEILDVFKKIYSDLKEISTYTTVSEFVENIKRIGFEKFREENYLDIVEKFYQAVDNIKSSERLCGRNGFKSLFETGTGANLYTLFIKYMEGVEIKEVERDEKDKILGVVKNISEARLNNFDIKNSETYFIDIDSSSIPGNLKDNLNFTEIQREKNSFMTFEDKRNIIKYRFIQGIFNSRNCVIFTRKDANGEKESSSFLDEIMMKYNLSPEKVNPLSKDDIFEILRKNLLKNENQIPEKLSGDYFILEKSSSDFKDNKMVLGTYDLIDLEKCQYRYFLKSRAEIFGESDDIYGTSLRFLGIVVHKIFEKITDKIYMNIKNYNNFYVDEKYVNETAEGILLENKMKIPVYLDLFFQEIMFPKIKENIFKFYREIERELAGKKIKIFWSEKGKTENVSFLSDKMDIFITGRADLVIETEDGEKYIVDYKTGGKKGEQLDIYSIIMYGDENAAKKIIYNAVQGEYEKLTKTDITKEKLMEEFENFIESSEYRRAEKKSACTLCEYGNICRREGI